MPKKSEATPQPEKRPLKIAVYAITKNEEKFVEGFVNCAKDEADYVIIADTGSDDNTVALAKQFGAIVHDIRVRPWRFDVARNAAMALIPEDVDVCISLDLDERLTPGFRKAIEEVWVPGVTTRLNYKFVWSFNDDGTPGVEFWYEKIHARWGYLWAHPVHEYPVPDGRINEVYARTHDFRVEHYPDPTKSRGQYLPLLELSMKEQPNDPRNAHYYGRELMFHGRYEDAIRELENHLKISDWHSERSASMRYIGKSFWMLGKHNDAYRWYLRACAEAPETREVWYDFGRFCYEAMKDYNEAFNAFTKALQISEDMKGHIYICDPEAWGWWIYEHAALAAWYSMRKDECIALYEEALRRNADLYTPRVREQYKLALSLLGRETPV